MKKQILICCGTGCRANGSMNVVDAFRSEIEKSDADADVIPQIKTTGCNGFCENGPIVKIMPDNLVYYKVKPKDVPEILEKSVLEDQEIPRLMYKDNEGNRVRSQEENPFYAHQQKLALRHIGKIDAENIEDYLELGGYEALRKALQMTPDEVITEVEESGLRGRGGAGFPAGRKWRTAASYDNFPKYVACNGDEGDPGAFMDRSILEGDPHAVIEGLAIAAIAIGAEEGFFYIRDEYDLAVKHVKKALEDAEARGIIGKSVMGSSKRLHLSVVRGGGAFVCGESTALMASVEGRVGEPRAKYIRSVQKGLWNQPTVLNNVETLANIPLIIRDGGKKFAEIGTETSTGTKVFALVGNSGGISELCRKLCGYGMSGVRVHIGERLSYPDEKISSGTPGDFSDYETDGLSVVLLENPQPERVVTPGIPDEAFLRDKVPMTKEEVREICMCKLRLTEDAVVYDIGGGTGSVSIEAARLAVRGTVYSIEKNPSAVALIRENKKKFAADNLEIIEGLAPGALRELPAPTHAFLGGTSGNLAEIMELLYEKNPSLRVVITAITLETVAEAVRYFKGNPRFEEPDIAQISAAKGRTAGSYHLMMGQNPVYIISSTGNGNTADERGEES